MKLFYEFCLSSIKVKAFCIIKPIHLKLIPLFLLFSAFCSAAQSWTGSGFFKQNIDNKIEKSFHNPPDQAKPLVWWHWMNGNITRAGITSDLEAMKRIGIGGVQVFQVTNSIPKGAVNFMSPAWLELMNFAIHEAARLNLSFTILNCAGWSNSGGPWVKPEQGMQMLAWTDQRISGPQHYSGLLPQAQFEERLYGTGPATGYRRGTAPLKPVGSRFYRDIAVLAFPTSAKEPELREQRNTLLHENLYLEEKSQSNPTEVTKRSQVINLTSFVLPGGRLKWDVPSGNWTILRIGYTPTDQINHPAPDGGEGLECDKFSRAALQTVWNGLSQVVIDKAGPLAGSTLNSILIDSWEVGEQQWSPQYMKEFSSRRGYDPIPWLPVLSGRIVESRELSDRFLWDMRRTNADLIADNYFGEFTRLCNRNGLQSTAEAYGGPFDEVQASGKLDIPMGEFWVGKPDQPVSSEMPWSSRLSASAAHGYGKPIVAAEAFTARPADGKWSNDPYSLKIRGDWAFCQGINRFVFHRYAHQPWLNERPGMTMGPYGINFERTNTWWEQSRAWISYISRCQFLLQQGRFFADVAYFPGDQAPTKTLRDPGLSLKGYDFDVLSADLLLQLHMVNGRLTLPSGMHYAVLVIGGDGRLRSELIAKIRELSLEGASISCPRPLGSPTLRDYPKGDALISSIVSEMWDSKRVETCDATTLLNKTKVPMDVDSPLEFIHRQAANCDIYYLANPRRKAIDCSVVFNVTGRRAEFWHPDTGDIEPVNLLQVRNDGRTSIPLHLDPAGSLFVVFREKSKSNPIADITQNGQSILAFDTLTNTQSPLTLADGGKGHAEARVWIANDYIVHLADGRQQSVNVGKIPPPVEITGPWRVQFPPKLGAPSEVTFDSLFSWTNHSDAGVRYFSGTACYSKTFQLPASCTKKENRLVLNLGNVKNIAEVTLNGVKLGILWKPPFSVDITKVAKTGDNNLEIFVTNQWINRLIGDEQEPPDCTWGPGEHGIVISEWPAWFLQNKPRPSPGRITFTTFKFYEKDSPLVISGLLGPVTIQVAVAKALN